MANHSGSLALLKFKGGSVAEHVADVSRRPADFFKPMRNRLADFNGHLPRQFRGDGFQSPGGFFQDFARRT